MKLLKYEEYSPRTSEIYDQLSSDLKKLLPNARIEHIGSSVIAGSLSKGDLDVLVAVESNEFNETFETIESIGFTEKQDTLRTDELCMLTTDKYKYDVAVQLVVKESKFESFITFRDALLEDSNLVEGYNELKQKYATLDEDTYRNKKGEFISHIIK